MSSDAFYSPNLVPVFPLPNAVLFPNTIIPLHIFEPRYVKMIRDVLSGDGTLAIALLKPGWEPLYYTRRPPVHTTICVGQVVESEQVDDGKYNLLLRGATRAHIIDEIMPEDTEQTPYRVAQVEPVLTYASGDETLQQDVRGQIVDAIHENPGISPDLRKSWEQLAATPVELDAFTDLVAAGLPVDVELRQCFLEEPDALERGERMSQELQTIAAMARNLRRVGPRDHDLN